MTDIIKSLMGIGIGISFIAICAITEAISPIPLKYDQRNPKKDEPDRCYISYPKNTPEEIEHVHYHYHIGRKRGSFTGRY
jgi:hypothetical protein